MSRVAESERRRMPASKISTCSPQRISTQQVSLPKSQFAAAGAGMLPRAPQIRTRKGAVAIGWA